MTNLRLRPMRTDDEAMVRAAHAELAADDFAFALSLDDGLAWPDYLERLAALERGDVPEGMVPSSLLVADVDGEVIGRSSIRYELNDWLREYGGHIGYGVRPQFRRRGYAREILRQSLIIARSRGVGRVMVTCDDTNVASAATIESQGGALDRDRPYTERDGVRVRRYWID